MMLGMMQRNRLAVAIAAAAMLVLPAACERRTDMAEVREETREAVETMQAYAKQQREEHREIMQERLKNIHAQIQALREELAGLQKQAATEIQGSIETLDQNFKKIDQELADIESTEKAEWDKIRAELNMAINELESAYQSAAQRLDVPVEGDAGAGETRTPTAPQKQNATPGG
jgi:DNA repair exonuclease SbcCD ATPase subunit